MEIILLILFTRKIHRVLKQKGHKSGWYLWMSVVLFFIGEGFGALAGSVLSAVTGATNAYP